MSENAWQPIETAPKDGTEILGYAPDGFEIGHLYRSREIGVMYFNANSGDWETHASFMESSPGTYDTMYCEGPQTAKPTHWQPLPPPPPTTESGK